MLLNLGLVLHPDLHPEALLLAVAATQGVPIVPRVGFIVLEFPGLNIGQMRKIFLQKLNILTSHSSMMASKGVTALTAWSPIKASKRATFILSCCGVGEIFVLKESQYNYVI